MSWCQSILYKESLTYSCWANVRLVKISTEERPNSSYQYNKITFTYVHISFTLPHSQPCSSIRIPHLAATQWAAWRQKLPLYMTQGCSIKSQKMENLVLSCSYMRLWRNTNLTKRGMAVSHQNIAPPSQDPQWSSSSVACHSLLKLSDPPNACKQLKIPLWVKNTL
jgi:hypothetical protein